MSTIPYIAPPADGLPMPRRLWAILAVAFGVGLSVLDSAIANVALPTIGQELGISSADSIWIVNAYQLAIMVSLLSFSALGELVGYRKVYIGGLMLFTVASVGCALSSSLATLVLARVMQGFGAAAVTSVNTTLIRIIYPKAQLGRGLGLNATVVAVSSVAGPTIAAGILSIAHWPWLFAVNIPVGLVALSLSRRFLPDNPVRVGTHRFDWRDAVMNALTFLLAFLPDDPAPFDIAWRLVLCGAGFGLFQSPNNSILIASAPPQRSGSASGMLATARLVGQTTGAALMALLFHIVPENSTHTALLLAGGFALTGAVVSITRIRLPLPEGLTRRRK